MANNFVANQLVIDAIDYSLMSSISKWCVRLLFNYLIIIHRLVIDYTHLIQFLAIVFLNFFQVIKSYVNAS